MTSPAPLLKIPTPGNRKPPKLTVGIPPSPNARPINQIGTNDEQQTQQFAYRQLPPELRIATPMGSRGTIPQEDTSYSNGRPMQQPYNSSQNDLSTHSRTGSFTNDGKQSGPASAASSSFSALSLAMGMKDPLGNTRDPSSAISSVYSDRDGGLAMERENSSSGILPDLDKLSLELGRPLDVEDLDDEKWAAASEQGKIIELDSLGEGAGGAVTRCLLKGGKTVFALKV